MLKIKNVVSSPHLLLQSVPSSGARAGQAGAWKRLSVRWVARRAAKNRSDELFGRRLVLPSKADDGHVRLTCGEAHVWCAHSPAAGGRGRFWARTRWCKCCVSHTSGDRVSTWGFGWSWAEPLDSGENGSTRARTCCLSISSLSMMNLLRHVMACSS